MASIALSEKDSNAIMNKSQNTAAAAGKGDVKSMEYHRQLLQSKMQATQSTKYVSPSDILESPCTSKIKALRSKNAAKVKPRSLFAQTTAKRMEGDDASKDPFGRDSAEK